MAETAIKERPILFSAPMVRAILEGRKTQTRRVVKPQPELPHRVNLTHHDGTIAAAFCDEPILGDGALLERTWCPYGKPGDRLWVRETFATWTDENSDGCIVYQADGACREALHDCGGAGDLVGLGKPTTPVLPVTRWRPSIHMPRHASRILLEVTDVRVERLQAISAKDANAEGMRPRLTFGEEMKGSVECFRELWDSINGGFGWASNPWVWCISFKRLEAPHANP